MADPVIMLIVALVLSIATWWVSRRNVGCGVMLAMLGVAAWLWLIVVSLEVTYRIQITPVE